MIILLCVFGAVVYLLCGMMLTTTFLDGALPWALIAFALLWPVAGPALLAYMVVDDFLYTLRNR